jgi:quercetin dioxygenase-like cupin family protein
MEFPKWITSLPAEQHEFLSYQLEGKTCDTYFSEVKEGTFIPPHQHDNTVLNFVAEGQITVEQNGKKQTYKTGDWCEIPKGTTHTLHSDTDSRLIEFWLK